MKNEEGGMKNEERVHRWHQYLCFGEKGKKEKRKEKKMRQKERGGHRKHRREEER
jgi:hypothetical protein